MMEYLFSDLKDYNDKTLYIIGNGFDVYHGIPSRYENFYHWLMCKGKNKFVKDMEEIFTSRICDKSILWTDFEKAIGEYDIDAIFDNYSPKEDRFINEYTMSAANEKIGPVIDEITSNITKWIHSISLAGVEQLLPLPQNSRYLTFNYTLTLENIYEIPRKQITYIHNNVLDSNVIVGNNRLESEQKIEDLNLDYYEETSKKRIVMKLSELYKDPYKQIKSHAEFFDSIKDYKRVVVLGHSLSEIDKIYFGHIKSRVAQDAHWHFSKYSPNDEERINNMVEERCISRKNRWIFNL